MFKVSCVRSVLQPRDRVLCSNSCDIREILSLRFPLSLPVIHVLRNHRPANAPAAAVFRPSLGKILSL